MPIDDLPGTFYVPTGTEIEAQSKRDYTLADPYGSTDDGTLPAIDAAVTRDMLLPIYHNTELAGNAAASLSDMSLTQLRTLAVQLGLPDLLPASGSTGIVSVQGSVSGGLIANGAIAYNPNSNITYTSQSPTQVYLPGQAILLLASVTGPQGDIPAGTVLQWRSPAPGINPNCVVQVASDGGGIEGGSPEETQDQLIARIEDAYANPPAAGNDAAIRAAATNFIGVGVEETWSYPAIWGAGTTGVVFTVRPQFLNDGVTPIPSTRIPSATQVTLIQAAIEGACPGDDGIIMCMLNPVPQDVYYQIVWDQSVDGWSDLSPWPLYSSGNPVNVTTIIDALHFSLDCSGATVNGSQLPPQPGMHIAFWNAATNSHVLKTILTATLVTASTYAIVCDSTFGSSDTTYTPTFGDRPCPYSDSLSVLVPPTFVGLASLGPGEQVPLTQQFDYGVRWKRQPTSPAQWPSVIGTKSLVPIDSLSSIDDVSYIFPVAPYQTPIGTQGVASNLLVQGRVLAFSQ